MKLSMIVPCYNEAENVAAFQEATIAAFANCGFDYEIVFIDDGSRDRTGDIIRQLHADHPEITGNDEIHRFFLEKTVKQNVKI